MVELPGAVAKQSRYLGHIVSRMRSDKDRWFSSQMSHALSGYQRDARDGVFIRGTDEINSGEMHTFMVWLVQNYSCQIWSWRT